MRLTNASRRLRATSQTATALVEACFAIIWPMAVPRTPAPIRAHWMRSLAPNTLPGRNAAVAAVAWINERLLVDIVMTSSSLRSNETFRENRFTRRTARRRFSKVSSILQDGLCPLPPPLP